MNDTFFPLEEQFDLARLKVYLKEHPNQAEEAYRLAIAHFESYLRLASEYQKLQAENEDLKAQLEANSNRLHEEYVLTQVEKVDLRIENQRLMNIAKSFYILTFFFFMVLLFL